MLSCVPYALESLQHVRTESIDQCLFALHPRSDTVPSSMVSACAASAMNTQATP